MRVARVRVQNFRCIKDLTVEMSDVTRFIGGNGAGKSTVLRALDLFYAPGSPALSRDDFFHHNDQNEIEIALTYRDLSESEQKVFGAKIDGKGEMTVARVFFPGGGKSSGLYYGAALKNQNFDFVRSAPNKTEARANYKIIQEKYPELPAVGKADEIEEHFQAWEAANPDKCQLGRDDGRFFGFTNVAAGKLQETTSFVFVPAVRDASADAAEGKGTVISQLMDLVVRSAVEARDDIRQLQAEFDERYQQVIDPSNLPELGNLQTELTSTLKSYYDNAGVLLDWKESEPVILPLPNALIKLDDDGFETQVDRTGHGLQRALIFTLLQHLALASRRIEDAEDAEEKAVTHLPGLILAIEEPELYQHPTKQRHLARVLEELAAGTLPGVATNTQVIFATHSPLFVSMDRFDELRIVRRHSPGDGEPREAASDMASLQQMAEVLEGANERPPGTFSAQSLRPRLHVVDAAVAEGFFSSVAVLVEGVSDKAALVAVAALQGIDFEEKEIAIIPVHGKGKLDKVAAVFRALGCPTYVIWDNDNGEEDEWANLVLQRLGDTVHDELNPVVTRVAPSYACFEDKLEVTLREEISEQRFNEILGEYQTKFDVQKRSDAQKTPEIMKMVLSAAAKENLRSPTLDGIVAQIMALWENSNRRPRADKAKAAPG